MNVKLTAITAGGKESTSPSTYGDRSWEGVTLPASFYGWTPDLILTLKLCLGVLVMLGSSPNRVWGRVKKRSLGNICLTQGVHSILLSFPLVLRGNPEICSL
jgi:hypothetical protein